MKIRFLFFILLISTFLLEVKAQPTNSNLEVFLTQRNDLAKGQNDYMSLELQAVNAGLRIPALVTRTFEANYQVLEFYAYKIVTDEDRSSFKVKIAQGTPSILHVEITGNKVKATFDANADVHHLNTLFRMLGYNSYELYIE